jgi:hypothetical protein
MAFDEGAHFVAERDFLGTEGKIHGKVLSLTIG